MSSQHHQTLRKILCWKQLTPQTPSPELVAQSAKHFPFPGQFFLAVMSAYVYSASKKLNVVQYAVVKCNFSSVLVMKIMRGTLILKFKTHQDHGPFWIDWMT